MRWPCEVSPTRSVALVFCAAREECLLQLLLYLIQKNSSLSHCVLLDLQGNR